MKRLGKDQQSRTTDGRMKKLIMIKPQMNVKERASLIGKAKIFPLKPTGRMDTLRQDRWKTYSSTTKQQKELEMDQIIAGK